MAPPGKSFEAGDGGILENAGAVALRRSRKPSTELAHMHLGALPIEQPAVEAVGADFGADSFGWNQIGFGIGLPVQQVEATGNFIVVRGLGRELDLAATAETAGDLLLLHDALHRIHSGIIGMIEGAGLVHAQTLGETAEIDRRAVVDVAAVAARGAADDAISLQHHNTGATPGQRQARPKAR